MPASVTPEYLLKGAAYALEQCGLLLRHANLLYRNGSYAGVTPRFWGGLDAICGPDEWRLWGLPTCAKGEPLQLCPVSHGAPPILVNGLQMSERK